MSFSTPVIKGNPEKKTYRSRRSLLKESPWKSWNTSMNSNSDAAMNPAELTSHGQRHPVDAQHVLKQKQWMWKAND